MSPLYNSHKIHEAALLELSAGGTACFQNINKLCKNCQWYCNNFLAESKDSHGICKHHLLGSYPYLGWTKQSAIIHVVGPEFGCIHWKEKHDTVAP